MSKETGEPYSVRSSAGLKKMEADGRHDYGIYGSFTEEDYRGILRQQEMKEGEVYDVQESSFGIGDSYGIYTD